MTMKHKTYLGQPARIARAFTNHDGQMTYALKTSRETIAVSKHKDLLIDMAETLRLEITKIAD
jgi:hypothetical protein